MTKEEIFREWVKARKQGEDDARNGRPYAPLDNLVPYQPDEMDPSAYRGGYYDVSHETRWRALLFRVALKLETFAMRGLR